MGGGRNTLILDQIFSFEHITFCVKKTILGKILVLEGRNLIFEHIKFWLKKTSSISSFGRWLLVGEGGSDG